MVLLKRPFGFSEVLNLEFQKKKRNWNAVFQAFPHDIPEPQVFLFMRNEDFISQIVGVPEDQRVKSAVD
jgi:hypothetical protein